MRSQVRELLELGPLPATNDVKEDVLRLEEYERLLNSISPPVSDAEALALVTAFGPDECFGLAWGLVHLIESAPGWPMLDQLPESGNEWVQLLRDRVERAKPR